MVETLEKIERFISSSEKLTWEEVAWLESMSKKYPYFQTLHIWIAKHYIKEEHLLKNHKIQTASIFAVDRTLLKKRLLEKGKSSGHLNPESIRSEIHTPAEEKQVATETLKPKEKTREELLAAVEDRLKELNSTQKIESTKKPTATPSITESKTEIAKKHSLKEEEKPKSKEKSIPKANTEEKNNDTTVPKTKKIKASEAKQEKEQADEELKKIISDSIKPKDLFYSRLGNELNIDSSDSIDLLLNYLESQKEKKIQKENPKNVDFIVQNFIKNDPKISKLKANQKEEGEDLTANLYSNKKYISENLAKIQAKQGYIKEAIDIYKELMLKFPEKKTYFAEQIKKLK